MWPTLALPRGILDSTPQLLVREAFDLQSHDVWSYHTGIAQRRNRCNSNKSALSLNDPILRDVSHPNGETHHQTCDDGQSSYIPGGSSTRSAFRTVRSCRCQLAEGCVKRNRREEVIIQRSETRLVVVSQPDSGGRSERCRPLSRSMKMPRACVVAVFAAWSAPSAYHQRYGTRTIAVALPLSRIGSSTRIEVSVSFCHVSRCCPVRWLH